jgi:hypothetical protein
MDAAVAPGLMMENWLIGSEVPTGLPPLQST